MMKENLIDKYHATLPTQKNVGAYLARFMSELFETETNRSHIIFINKMVRLYGRELVFFAISDMYFVDDVNVNDCHGLLVHFIQKRAGNKFGQEWLKNTVDLTSYVKKAIRDFKKQKKEDYDFTNPFEEQE